MARIEFQMCSCCDYPCCGCSRGEAFTGEDAVEQWEQDLQLKADTPFREGDDEVPLTDYETDTPLGQLYGDGFEPE